ncbi:MAG: replication initiator protein A [Xanthomonadales bacterium]|nr:replication initiator protein A [Xanthomonadales bacterium]
MSKTSRGKDPTVKGEVQSSLFDSPVADDHANVITALQADFEIPKGLIERLKPEEAKNFLDALRETAELLAAVSDEDAPKPASGSPFLASLGLSAEVSGADDTPLMSSSGPPQFFVCDAIDPPVKDDMASMEHPMFTLQKTPDKNIRKYEHNGVHIEITPSVKGMATLWDKDILIVAISHLLAKMNSGIQTHRTVRFRASEMLRTTQRGIGGSAYMQLVDGLDRLAGTRIKTDIKTGNRRTREGFGLIELEGRPGGER